MDKSLENLKLLLHVYADEIRQVLFLVFVIIPLICLPFLCPPILRNAKLNNLDQRNLGTLDTLITVKAIKQTDEGNRWITWGYKLKYHFDFAEKVYHGEEYIPSLALKRNSRYKLHKLEPGSPIEIRFASDAPNKSMVSLK